MTNDCPPNSDPHTYYQRVFNRAKRWRINCAVRGYRYYVETNHQFAKRIIHYAVPCYQDRLRIVHLVRPVVDVAASFYAIGSIPGRTARGYRYLLDPNDPANVLPMGDILDRDPEFQHDFYRCVWYWYEMEARIAGLRLTYDGIPWYRITTSELNQFDPVKEMFTALSVDFSPDRLAEVVGVRINRKLHDKASHKASVDHQNATRMHARFLEVLTTRHGDRVPRPLLTDQPRARR
jgi:hypothetical protein